MAMTEKQKRMTLEIDDRNLFRAIKLMAVERDCTMKDIVTEALKAWLRQQEDAEDAAAIAEVENDERAPWAEVIARLGIDDSDIDSDADEEMSERGR